MAAFQADITAANMLAADNGSYEDVFIQNLGPNTIWADVGATAAAATGVRILPGQEVWMRRPPATLVSVICPTALQVTPNDTRVVRS